ncbi:dihydrofolate reductase family protein (plasmid) [Deinococcus sp. D7000]|nr:dihydrofolate reductase family protein [Deinococcus sp. D7000]
MRRSATPRPGLHSPHRRTLATPLEVKPGALPTHRPLESEHGEERFEGELTELLERLAHEGHQHVYLDGGDVVRQGLRANRVTDLTLSWLPIVLGSGIALFERGLPERRWRLISSRAFPSGLLQATYEAVASGNGAA